MCLYGGEEEVGSGRVFNRWGVTQRPARLKCSLYEPCGRRVCKKNNFKGIMELFAFKAKHFCVWWYCPISSDDSVSRS